MTTNNYWRYCYQCFMKKSVWHRDFHVSVTHRCIWKCLPTQKTQNSAVELSVPDLYIFIIILLRVYCVMFVIGSYRLCSLNTLIFSFTKTSLHILSFRKFVPENWSEILILLAISSSWIIIFKVYFQYF